MASNTFRHTCELCQRFIVWQNEGVWFCWYCDESNTTNWRSKPRVEMVTPVDDFEDDFVYVESERKQEQHGELRNQVLGCLVGFAISEAIGFSAKDGPPAIQTEGVEPQPGTAQLLMALDCLLGTAEDSSMAQEDFAKRLLGDIAFAPPCWLTRRVLDHPKFSEAPEKAAREVWDETKEAKHSNSALARAIAAGVFFQGDDETAAAAAKALTTATHNDPRSRHSGAAVALSASVAKLLSRPRADAYGVANEAFEAAAADLHEEEQEDEIFELHRHLFPADLEDLELADLNEMHSVLKALGAGFYCLTSNRIQNPLSKEDAEQAGNLSAAESLNWANVDDEQLMNPVVLDSAVAGFSEALAAQMKQMEARLLALAGEQPGSAFAAKAAASTMPKDFGLKPRPNAETRQVVFQEQITMLALEGGSSTTNCAVAGALLGAHFGLDGLPPAWLEGLGPRVQTICAYWDGLSKLYSPPH